MLTGFKDPYPQGYTWGKGGFLGVFTPLATNKGAGGEGLCLSTTI